MRLSPPEFKVLEALELKLPINFDAPSGVVAAAVPAHAIRPRNRMMVMLRFNTFPILSVGLRGPGAWYSSNVSYASKIANIFAPLSIGPVPH